MDSSSKLIKLIILGDDSFFDLAGNRIRNLVKYLPENIDVEYHIIGLENEKNRKSVPHRIIFYTIKQHKLPLLKRRKLNTDFCKLFLEKNPNLDHRSTIVLFSSPPSYLTLSLVKLGIFYKTIFDIRDIYQEWSHHPFLKRIIEKYEQKSVLRNTDLITYAHPNFKKYILKDVKNESKLRYISNGADAKIFNPNYPIKQLLPKNRIHIIFAGRFEFYHGVNFWIDVMDKLPEEKFHLTLIGDGIAIDSLKEYINKLGVNEKITFLGKIDQTEVPIYLASADYALASYDSKDFVILDTGRPTKIFEALLCGTPVIFKGGKGGLEFLKEFPNDFFLFEDNNIKNVVDILSKLEHTSMNRRLNIAEKANKLYNFKSVSANFLQIINELASV